jgi:hypothetical protein
VVTKGFRAATHATSGLIVDTSRPGNKHQHEQNIVKEFFYQDPTPAHVKIDEGDIGVPKKPVQSWTASNIGASISFAIQHVPTAANPLVKFYSQLLE